MLFAIKTLLLAPLAPVGLFSGYGGGVTRRRLNTDMKISSTMARLDLADMRQRMELVLHDSEGHECERLRYKIKAARQARELWMIRSDLYQLIARQQSQSEAARRINSLLPIFEGWLPADTLISI
jgi:hypothetical protein